MSKLKRIATTILGLVMGMSVFAGCSPKGSKTVRDEHTVNVQVIKAGYGTDWIYELKPKFEAAFAEQGYKVNILVPSRDIEGSVVINDLARGYDETGVDLYITATISNDSVGKNGEYGVIAEDITETVFNKPAYKYDGTEEDVLISEKINADIVPYMVDSEGAMYSFNWVQSVAGLVVNTRKLKKYGITEMPRTTNEMFEQFEAIYLGANGIKDSETTKTFPITYVSGTNGYTVCFLNALMAQYDAEAFDRFWSMERANDDGTRTAMTTDGYEVFNDPAVTKMLEVAHRTFDQNIAAYGSTTQNVDQAQAKIMKDKDDAVFMFNGDWMLNEVKLNYRNNLDDIEFINFPVISALGEKLFCKAPYNLNADKADELLSLICKLTDENKTVDEIIAGVKSEMNIDLDKADAQEVATARGTYYSRGIENKALITKNALGKDVAAALLRMMASEDFAKTFAESSNATTPYTKSVNNTTNYKFVEEASKIAVNDHVRIISGVPKGFRKDLGLSSLLTLVSHIPSDIASRPIESIYDGNGHRNDKTIQVYATAAATMQTADYNNVKSRWSSLLQSAGYTA